MKLGTNCTYLTKDNVKEIRTKASKESKDLSDLEIEAAVLAAQNADGTQYEDLVDSKLFKLKFQLERIAENKEKTKATKGKIGKATIVISGDNTYKSKSAISNDTTTLYIHEDSAQARETLTEEQTGINGVIKLTNKQRISEIKAGGNSSTAARSDINGNINPNAKGIITSKNEVEDKAVRSEKVEKITEEDEDAVIAAMEKDIDNIKLTLEASDSPYNKVIFPKEIIGDMSEKVAMALATMLKDKLGLEIEGVKPKRPNSKKYKIILGKAKTEKTQKEKEEENKTKSEKKAQLEEARESLTKERPTEITASLDDNDVSTLVRTFPKIDERKARIDFISNKFSINLSEYIDSVVEYLSNLPASEMRFPCRDTDLTNQEVLDGLTKGEESARRIFALNYLKGNEIPDENGNYSDSSLTNLVDKIFNDMHDGLVLIGSLNAENENDVEAVAEMLLDDTEPLGKTFLDEAYQKNWGYLDNNGIPTKNLVKKARQRAIHLIQTFSKMKDAEVFKALMEETKYDLEVNEGIVITGAVISKTKDDVDNEELDEEKLNLGKMDFITKYRLVNPKETLSKRIKSLLNGLTKVTKDKHGNIITEYDDLGQPVKLNSAVVYYILLDKLSNMIDEDDFDKKLMEMSESYPWMNAIIERITPVKGKEKLFDWDLRKEFYRAMNKTFVQFAFISSNGNLVNCNMKNSSEVIYDIANKNYEGGNTLSRYSIYDSSGMLQEKNLSRLRGLLIDNKKNSEKKKKEFTDDYQKEHKSLLWAFQTLKNVFTNKRRKTPEKIIEEIKEALLILRAEHPNKKFNNISLEELIKSLGIDTYNINMDAMLPILDTENIDYKIDPKTEDIYVPSIEIDEETGEEIEIQIPVFTKDLSNRIKKILSNAIDVVSRAIPGVPVIYNNKRSYLEIGTALTIVSDGYTEASFRFGNKSRFSYVVPSYIDKLCNSIQNEDDEAALDYIDKHYGGYDFYQNRTTGAYNSAWLRMLTSDSKTAQLLRRNFRVLQILGFGGSGDRNVIQNLTEKQLLEGGIDLYFSANTVGDINFAYYLNPLYSDVDARSAFQFRRWTAHNEINDEGVLVKDFDFKTKIISELVNSFKQDLNRVRAIRAGNNQEDIEFFNSGKKNGAKLCFFPEFNKPFTVKLGEQVIKFNGIDDLLEYTARQDDEEASARTEREDAIINAILTDLLERLSNEFINSIDPRYKQKLFNRMKKRAGMEVQETKSSDSEDSLFDSSEEEENSSLAVEIYGRYWTREEVAKKEDKVFLFGDNTEDRESGYIPSSTQAVIRGLPNAIGIDTKKNRGTSEESYFTDDDFDVFKERVDAAIQEAIDTGKVIVLPKDGIGTGKAQLKERAPKLFEYLESQLDALKDQSSVIEDDVIVEADKLLEEFYYNNFLAKNQLIQLLGGDLALYKNFTDFIKRNKQCFASGERLYSKDENGNTIYEYGLYLEDTNRASNSLKNISDLLDQDTTINEDEKAVIRGAFYNITTTDGQSLRSLTSFKKLLTAMGGKWNDKMTEAYNRLKSGEVTAEDFNVLWQPIKPFLFSYETRMVNGRREKIYTQHKNSEYLLSAMYTLLNTALNKSPLLVGINKFLENNNIDAVHFHSVVKEGYNNGINLNYSPDNFSKNIIKREEDNGTRYFRKVGDILIEVGDIESLDKSLKDGEISYREYKKSLDNMYEKFMKEITSALANKEITSDDYNKAIEDIEFSSETEVYDVLQKITAITEDEIELLNDPESGYRSPKEGISPRMVHSFPISDYMIMQPTDDHLVDTVAKFGSQLRNIIYADLGDTFTRTIKLGGKSKTLSYEESVKFYNYLITSQLVRSFSKINDEFSSAKRIEEMLQRKMKLQPSKYPPEIRKALTLDENGNFQLPFNSPNLRNKIEDLLLSEFKNHIQKQSIKGGNAVLVSNFGLHKDLKVQYKEIEVDGKKKKVVDYIPVYMTHTMASQLKDFCVQKGNIMQLDFKLIEKKLGKEVADDLCKAIGYRIPTEDKYSIFPVRIIGFMPAIGGCTVMMPSDVVEMSGTDFDIDKLFFMLKEIRRETHNNKLRKAFIKWLAKRQGLDNNAYEQFIDENSDIDISTEGFSDENKKAWNVAKSLFRKKEMGVTEEEIASAEKESMIFTYFMSEEGFNYKNENPVYNILRPTPVLDKNGELDIWKTIDNAKKAEIDNMLIDSIFDVLTSPEGSQLMMRQGTFRNVKETSRVRRIMKDRNALEAFNHQYNSIIRREGLYGAFQYILKNGITKNGKKIDGFTALDNFYEQYATSRNPQDVLYEVNIFRNLMDGNDLIGMFAVNSSSHYKLQFYDVKLKFPIYINGQEITEIDSVYSPINGKRVGEICAQFQAASPDNGKDPCLGDLNISPKTVNIVSLLSRLGLDILDIGAIVDSENILSYKLEDLAIEDIDSLKKDIHKFNLDISKLEELKAAILFEDTKTLSDPENRLFILSFKLWYSYIRQIAKDLTSISSIVRSDSPNGALSSDYTTAIQQILAIKDLKNRLSDGSFTIDGLDDLVDFDLNATELSKENLMQEFSKNPVGRLEATFTLGIMSAPNIVKSRLADFSDASFKRFDMFMEETNIPLQAKIYAGVIKYLLTEFNMFLMTKEGLFNESKEGQTVMDKHNYYIHDFPIQYKKLKLEKNEDGSMKYENIFNLPSMMRLSNKNDKGIKMDNIGKTSPETRKWYTEAFDQLLNLKSSNEKENELAAKLAVDLLMYGFFDNGLNFRHNSFSIFFSSTYIKSIPGLVDLLREVENLTSKSDPVMDSRFLEQFLINHPTLITKVTGKNGVRRGDYLFPLSNGSGMYDNMFSTKSGKAYRKFVRIKLMGEDVIYERCIDPSNPEKLMYKKLDISNKGVPFYDATKNYSDIDYNQLQGRGNAKFKMSELEGNKEKQKVGPSSNDEITDNFSNDEFIPSSADNGMDGKDPMDSKTGIEFDDENDPTDKFKDINFTDGKEPNLPSEWGTQDDNDNMLFSEGLIKWASRPDNISYTSKWTSTEEKLKLEDLDEGKNGLCKPK